MLYGLIGVGAVALILFVALIAVLASKKAKSNREQAENKLKAEIAKKEEDAKKILEQKQKELGEEKKQELEAQKVELEEETKRYIETLKRELLDELSKTNDSIINSSDKVVNVDDTVKEVDNNIRELEEQLKQSKEEIETLKQSMDDLLSGSGVNHKTTHSKLDDIIDNVKEKKTLEEEFAEYARQLKTKTDEIDNKTQTLNEIIKERNALAKQKAEFKKMAQKLIDDISVQDNDLKKDYYEVHSYGNTQPMDSEFEKVKIVEKDLELDTDDIGENDEDDFDEYTDDVDSDSEAQDDTVEVDDETEKKIEELESNNEHLLEKLLDSENKVNKIETQMENLKKNNEEEKRLRDAELDALKRQIEQLTKAKNEDVLPKEIQQNSVQPMSTQTPVENDEHLDEEQDLQQNKSPLVQSPQSNTSEFMIRFDKQGGLGGANSVSIKLYENLPFVTTPLKPGYEFVGYFDRFDGKGKKYYDSEGFGCNIWDKDCDATLFAYWILVPYSRFKDGAQNTENNNIDDILKMFDSNSVNLDNLFGFEND